MTTSCLPASSVARAAAGRAWPGWGVHWSRVGILCALVWFAYPSLRAESPRPSPKAISVVCQFDAPRLEMVGEDTRVQVADCEVSRRVGEPALPFRTVRLLLPPDSEVASLSAEAEVPLTNLPGFWRVEHTPTPTPTLAPGKFASNQPISDGPDPSIYFSDTAYPAAPAELASVQRMNGYDIAFVRVYPVAYQPLSGQLLSHSRLRVTLVLTVRSQSADLPPHVRGAVTDRQRVSQAVDNPELLTA